MPTATFLLLFASFKLCDPRAHAFSTKHFSNSLGKHGSTKSFNEPSLHSPSSQGTQSRKTSKANSDTTVSDLFPAINFNKSHKVSSVSPSIQDDVLSPKNSLGKKSSGVQTYSLTGNENRSSNRTSSNGNYEFSSNASISPDWKSNSDPVKGKPPDQKELIDERNVASSKLVLKLDRNYTPKEIAEYIFSTGDEKGVTQTVWEMVQDGQIMESRDDVILFLVKVQNELDFMRRPRKEER